MLYVDKRLRSFIGDGWLECKADDRFRLGDKQLNITDAGPLLHRHFSFAKVGRLVIVKLVGPMVSR
jgi:hypothetical protein